MLRQTPHAGGAHQRVLKHRDRQPACVPHFVQHSVVRRIPLSIGSATQCDAEELCQIREALLSTGRRRHQRWRMQRSSEGRDSASVHTDQNASTMLPCCRNARTGTGKSVTIADDSIGEQSRSQPTTAVACCSSLDFMIVWISSTSSPSRHLLVLAAVH